MDIVICTDSRYITPARVTIASICMSNSVEQICFHVITDEASLCDVNAIAKDVERYSQKFHSYCVDNDLCRRMLVDGGNHPLYFSKATYYRLLIASILPIDVEKVLYLDCDILVCDSIKELWEVDLTGAAVAAVSDMYEGDVSFYNRLCYDPSLGYFNGGVELLNLKYWRNHDLEKVFAAYVADHSDRIFHHDQDIMNATLRNVKIHVPLRFNVQDGFLYDDLHLLVWRRRQELEDAQNHPAIVHFTGRFKPWCKQCNHPWKKEYLRLASYIGIRESDFPVIEENTSFYKILRSFLVRLHVVKPTLCFSPSIPSLRAVYKLEQ